MDEINNKLQLYFRSLNPSLKSNIFVYSITFLFYNLANCIRHIKKIKSKFNYLHTYVCISAPLYLQINHTNTVNYFIGNTDMNISS